MQQDLILHLAHSALSSHSVNWITFSEVPVSVGVPLLVATVDLRAPWMTQQLLLMPSTEPLVPRLEPKRLRKQDSQIARQNVLALKSILLDRRDIAMIPRHRLGGGDKGAIRVSVPTSFATAPRGLDEMLFTPRELTASGMRAKRARRAIKPPARKAKQEPAGSPPDPEKPDARSISDAKAPRERSLAYYLFSIPTPSVGQTLCYGSVALYLGAMASKACRR